MDLAKCLSAAGDAIVPADKDLLLAQVKKYRKEGKEGNEAAVAAVEEMLGSYQAEHQTIVEQVAKAFNVKQREKPRPVQTPPVTEPPAAPTPPVVEAETQIQDFPAPLTDADAVRPELNVLIQQIEEAMDTGNIPTEQIPEVEETPTQATAPGPLAPQLEGLEEKHLRDVGATPEVYNNPHNYKDPNTTTPILDRFITRVKAASQQLGAKAGIRFRDLQASDFDTSAGPVVLQVGGDSDVRPANYMRGVLEDLYELAAEFNPQGVYVLLPEDLAVRGNPLGVQGGHFTENGIHYIIPRHLTNITEQGSHWTRPGENQYSPYAKLDAWSTLQHEFGHSLIHDFFFSGLTREERALFELGLKQAQPVVDPELLAKLDPGAQALLQKWLTFRADVNNNRISGREAAARWLSPAKLQKKATFTKPGISWGGSDWSARNLRDALNTYDDRLSLDEFLAEQMPKYMYQRGLAGSKTLDAAYGGKFDAKQAENFVEGNIAAFFRPLMDLLQKVFNTMQVKGMIGPEKEFTDWVEGLSRRGRDAVKGEQGKGQAAAAPYQGERIDWSVPSRENKLKNALSSLVRSRVLNGNSKKYKELRRHLINEEWEEFIEGIEPLLGEKLKLDRTVAPGISYDITDDLTPPEDKRTQLLVTRAAKKFAGMFETGLEVKEWPGRRISNLSNFSTVMTSTEFKGAESLVMNVMHQRDAIKYQEYVLQFPEAAGDPFTVSNFSTLHMEYDEDTGMFSSYTDAALDNNMVELTPEGLYKLKGTTPSQIITMFGELLARISTRLKNSDIFVNWIRTSGANQGKEGQATFRLANTTTVPVQAYAPRRMLYVGTDALKAAFTNPLDALWISSLFTQIHEHGWQVPIDPVSVKVKNPLEVNLQGKAFTPAILRTIHQALFHLYDRKYDGAKIFNSSTLQGSVYLAFWPTKLPVSVAPVPATFPASLHFDISDPEEAMYASKWQTLKSKLSLPVLGESLSRLHRAKYIFLQTSQLAHNHPEWSWFTEFRQTVSKFYRRTAELHSRADAAIREINRTLGKEALAKLDKFTTDEFRGGEHWTDIKEEVDVQGRKHTVHVPGEKLLAKLREYGLDPDTLRGKKFASAYISAKNALAYQMDEFEQMLINIRWQKYRAHQNPLVMQQKIAEVIRTFRVLRAQPFWPQMTFGRYLVRVTKREGNHSYVVHEFGTESIKEWELEEQKVRAKYKKEQGFEIHSEDQKASTNEGVILMRLPVEFLDDLAVAMGLDNSQLDPVLDTDRIQENKDKLSQIRDLMQSLYEKSPTKTYDPMKRLIEGGSTDFVEKFASFALTTSNFIAKAEYRKLLDNTLQTAKAVSSALPAGREKAEIEVGRGFLKDTLHYLMDPQEEMHRARALVAVTYLAGNLATALMNFQGLSFTWAYLNRELGYFKGTTEFFKSMGSSARTLLKEFKDQAAATLAGAGDQAIFSITDPNWEMVDGKPTELRRAVEQAKEENVLDQSYAYYLAGHASRGSLARMTKYTWGRVAKGAIDISMAPFRGGELVIRRATFIAVYRTLERTQPGLTPQQRYDKATEMTLQLQGDYTKGNRPRLMRGKLPSLMFVFYTFPLNAAWQTYGGLELGLRRQEKLAGRATPAFYRNHGAQLTLLMLAMAGLEGLPFAENLFDVIDMIWKRWIEPGKSARTALREKLEAITDHPQRFIHGVAYDVGGFDLSRRIGLGRIVPGTEHLAENFSTTYEKIGKVGTSLLGVPGGYLNWMVDTFERVNQASEFGGMEAGVDKLGSQMARLPGGTGNIVKAFEWARYDARDHLGGLIAWDEATGKGRPTYWWEEVGKGIGFNPTAVSERQAMRAAQNDAIDYWQERRKWVLSNYFTAHEVTKDREAMADSARDLADFQQKVPFPEMRIKDLRRSMETRRRMMESSTNLIPVHKSYQPLAREIEESF